MPSAPELGHRGGQIGSLKVFHQMNAQNLGNPNGYGGIAPKVAVDLHGKEHRGHDQKPAGIGARGPVDRIHKNGDAVSQYDFQEESPEHF